MDTKSLRVKRIEQSELEISRAPEMRNELELLRQGRHLNKVWIKRPHKLVS